MMVRENFQKSMEEYIESQPKSTIYSAMSFNFLNNNDAVRKALSRMTKEGKLIRVTRGLYKPFEYSELIRETVATNPNEVAKAFAKSYGWTIAPYEDTALNLLGLSTQVPNVYRFISDGPYKKLLLFDGTVIEFKHKTIREISGLSYKTALLVEALKARGKNNITDNDRSIIRHKISKTDLENIKQEASKIRNWIYEEICKL